MEGSPNKKIRRSNSYSSLFGDSCSSSTDEDDIIITHGRKPIVLREGKSKTRRKGNVKVKDDVKPKALLPIPEHAPLTKQRRVNLILPKQPTTAPPPVGPSKPSKPVTKAKPAVEGRPSKPSTKSGNTVPTPIVVCPFYLLCYDRRLRL